MISILMPVKNAGKFLEDCLRGIQNQSLRDWQLLAVDDHSEDQSHRILQEFSTADPRINVFKNKGKGIIPALRTAYENSNADYITRMDADDIMPPNKLEELYAIAKEEMGILATGKVQYFSDEGVSEGYEKYQDWLNSLCNEDNHWDEIYKECVIPSPCWMLHRSDLDKANAFEADSYPEDYDLIFRFYETGLRVVSSDKLLHYWRDHPERTSRNHEHYAAQSFYELKLQYFLKLDYDPERPLVLWGAGSKGKRMAKLLQKAGIEFSWACNNPNKYGKEIYNQLLHDFREISTKDQAQIIVTVALRNAKEEIKVFLESLQLKENRDYWFFS